MLCEHKTNGLSLVVQVVMYVNFHTLQSISILQIQNVFTSECLNDLNLNDR